MRMRGGWGKSLTEEGGEVAAADGFPGGPKVLMSIGPLSEGRGGWYARVAPEGCLSLSTVVAGPGGARRWCEERAEEHLQRAGVCLSLTWTRVTTAGAPETWQAQGGPDDAPVMMRAWREPGGKTWGAIVSASWENVSQGGWEPREAAMAWCEETAAAYLRGLGL